jgi:hypothetical protein
MLGMDAADRSQTWLGLSARQLLLILIGYFVLLSVYYAFKASQHEGATAILRWQKQLVALQHGEDIFEETAYPNPPIMALILTPVVCGPTDLGLPVLVSGLLWFYLKVGMTLLCLRWVFGLIETPGQPFPLWAKVLTVILSLRSISGDLLHGNVNLFILFLVIGGLAALQKGRDFQAGLLIALAASCKVTPALFFPYLVWKRAWRSLAGCVAGIALFFWPGVVPALSLGWDKNLQCVASWSNQMVRPFVVEGFVTSEHNNQSLPGLVYRLLTHSPSFVTYIDNQWTPERYHNVLSLSQEAARWLVKLAMGLFALLVVWTCRTPRGFFDQRPSVNPRLAAEYSLILLGMLLFSERTWKHHCVTLLLPFAVLSYYLAAWQAQALRRNVLIGALAVAMLLMSTTSISLLGRESGKLAQVYGAYVIAFLVLAGALATILRQAGPASRAGLTAPVVPVGSRHLLDRAG